MIKANLDWNGDRALELTFGAAWEGIQRALLYFWALLQTVLSRPTPKETRTRKRTTTAGPKGSSFIHYFGEATRGGPPGLRTGFGRANVLYELDRESLSGRVGVGANAPYMAILELTQRLKLQRLWMLVTLRRNWDLISAQLEP